MLCHRHYLYKDFPYTEGFLEQLHEITKLQHNQEEIWPNLYRANLTNGTFMNAKEQRLKIQQKKKLLDIPENSVEMILQTYCDAIREFMKAVEKFHESRDLNLFTKALNTFGVAEQAFYESQPLDSNAFAEFSNKHDIFVIDIQLKYMAGYICDFIIYVKKRIQEHDSQIERKERIQQLTRCENRFKCRLCEDKISTRCENKLKCPLCEDKIFQCVSCYHTFIDK
ncbi:hypothetical protein [Neodiprion sertifer nucleopolyhedrovirus]|uniref:Uncharacterized protein n=1 Tax=Neodiprion sertifer nucleopolyhedrovirus TaxID=111874 RepID=Q6JK72_9CBAC|nr:hypothetical protein NeseNPV_gp88 [Neodiprion sertifer nucleopolyhedrovirus]AAQ96465.1 hypothetical protein [Neodiprion sertifer nucleopolyhedrovirus]